MIGNYKISDYIFIIFEKFIDFSRSFHLQIQYLHQNVYWLRNLIGLILCDHLIYTMLFPVFLRGSCSVRLGAPVNQRTICSSIDLSDFRSICWIVFHHFVVLCFCAIESKCSRAAVLKEMEFRNQNFSWRFCRTKRNWLWRCHCSKICVIYFVIGYWYVLGTIVWSLNSIRFIVSLLMHLMG